MKVLGYDISDSGCGSHGCVVKKPIGAGTNGGCSCFEQVKRGDMLSVKRIVTELANRVGR